MNDLKKELIKTKRDLENLQSNKHATKHSKPMITVPAAWPKATTNVQAAHSNPTTNVPAAQLANDCAACDKPRTSKLFNESSHVTRMVRSQDDVQVRGIRGGTINDVTTALKKHPTNDTSTVTLVIGSNDYDSPSTTTKILSDFKYVVDEAKRVATDNVVISSILPRMTTKIYQQKADTINSHLAK